MTILFTYVCGHCFYRLVSNGRKKCSWVWSTSKHRVAHNTMRHYGHLSVILVALFTAELPPTNGSLLFQDLCFLCFVLRCFGGWSMELVLSCVVIWVWGIVPIPSIRSLTFTHLEYFPTTRCNTLTHENLKCSSCGEIYPLTLYIYCSLAVWRVLRSVEYPVLWMGLMTIFWGMAVKRMGMLRVSVEKIKALPVKMEPATL